MSERAANTTEGSAAIQKDLIHNYRDFMKFYKSKEDTLHLEKAFLWLQYNMKLAAGEESSPEKRQAVAASSKLILSHHCAPQQKAKGILAWVNGRIGSGMRDFLFTQHLLDII